MQLPKKLHFLSVVFILSLLLLAYYNDLFSFFISGDDFWQYIEAPRTFDDVIYLFTFIQQYRPIPHIFFLVYHVLPFSVPAFHAISLICMIILSYIFYHFLTVNFKINKIVTLVVSLCWSTSHIIFYHLYTLSGIADLIFIFFFWMAIIFFITYTKSGKKSDITTFFIFFILSICTKEIFISIPIIILTYLIIFKPKTISKQKSIRLSLVLLLITILFYVIKIALYKSDGSSYSYTLSQGILFENIKHFTLWFLNYKHGWQMGMPVPPPKLYYILLAVWIVMTAVTFIIAFVARKKEVIFFIVWMIIGLTPFYFLDRVLVYYLNVSLLAFFAIVALGFDSIIHKKKYLSIFLCIYLLTSFYISNQIKVQWKQYSFVAVANETSENFYTSVIQKYDWKTYKVLCISELNPDAYWAIAGGQALSVFRKEDIDIISSSKKLTDPKCDQSSAIKVRNDGRNFIFF